MRTKARETLFKYVFSVQFSGRNNDLKEALYRTDRLTDEDREYCESVLTAIWDHEKEIGEMIDMCSESFPRSNIFPADRSILYIGCAEILYIDGIPDKVTLSETADIAAMYSSPNSPNFVNGVLSGVIKKNVSAD